MTVRVGRCSSRTTVVAVVVALVATLTPGASAGANASQEMRGPGGQRLDTFEPGAIERSPRGGPPTNVEGDLPVGEVVARTDRSVTERLPGGRYRTELSASRVNFQDEHGRWREIDDRLRRGRDGRWENRASDVTVSLPHRLGDGPARVEHEGRWVTVELRSASGGSAQVEGPVARYEDALPGVAVEMAAMPEGLKEVLVLEDPDATRSFVYDVEVSDGLVPTVDERGRVSFVDAAGGEAAAIEAPFMWDSAPGPETYSDAIAVEWEEQEAGWLLTWTVDDAYLDDPERQWPVMVDPQITMQAGRSCLLQSGVGSYEGQWDDSWACYTSTLSAGRELYQGEERKLVRSLLHFDVASVLPPGARVGAATLAMTQRFWGGEGPDDTVAVGAHVVTTGWDDGSATWNDAASGQPWTTPGGDHDPEPVYVNPDAGAAGGEVAGERWHITAAVQRWADGRLDNHGLLLRTVEEAEVGAISFWSKNYHTSSHRPRLTIGWQVPTGNDPNYGLEEFAVADGHELSVNVASGNAQLNRVDLSLPGVAGMDMEVVRSYSSLADFREEFGWNWGSTVSTWNRLWFAEDLRSVGVSASGPGDRGAANFVKQPDGSWEETDNFGAALEEDGDGFLLRWERSGEVWRYHPIGEYDSSMLDYRADRNGNRVTTRYSGRNVVSLEDSQGRVTAVARPRPNDGQPGVITDPAGRQHRYLVTGPSGAEQLTRYTDPAGRETDYGYTDGQLTSITDAAGNQTRIAYLSSDPAGERRVASVTRVTDPSAGTGPTTTFAYGNGQTTVTDPNGNETMYEYDGRSFVTKVVDARGNERSSEYTSDGNVASYTDRQGGTPVVNTYTEDGLANLTRSQLPTGAASTFDYDDADHPFSPTRYTTPQGNAISYDYDQVGNLASVEDAAAGATTLSYNTDGTVKSATDPNGNVTSYGYDPHGNLISIDHPGPRGEVTMTYDGLSRVTSVTDGEGQTTTYGWDIRDRLVAVTYQGGRQVAQGYDAVGNRVWQMDPSGTTTTSYDRLGRITGESLSAGRGATSYVYDPVGNLTELTDASGTVGYGYNAVNLVTSVTEPGSQTTTFGYDEANNRTTTTYPNGVTQTAAFDPSNRVTGIEALGPGGVVSDLSYSYAAAGGDTVLRQSVTDQAGETTSYVYDEAERLLEAVTRDAAGAVVAEYSYGYDAASNRVSQSADGVEERSRYDAANQLVATATDDQDGTETLLVLHDPASLNAADTVVKDRLEGLGHQVTLRAGSAPVDVDGFDLVVIVPSVWSVDVVGYGAVATPTVNLEGASWDDHHLTGESRTKSSTEELVVNDGGHLVADGPYGSLSGNVKVLDSVHRLGYSRASMVGAGAEPIMGHPSDPTKRFTVYGYAAGSELADGSAAPGRRVALGYDDDSAQDLSAEGWRLFDSAVAWATATTFDHDANGNLTGSSDGLKLGYNTAGQTTTIETAGQAEVTADYAGAGQIDRIALGGETFASTLLGVSRHDRAGAVQAVTRDPHGGLVGLRDPNRGRHYYLFDALGSVIAVTDATGQVVNRYDYDPYGTTTETCPTPTGCVDNPWRFTGEQQDPTGMYKIGHRYYQPEQGRWTQPDPLQGRINPAMPGETNPYAYAGCNPTNYTDPTGQMAVTGALVSLTISVLGLSGKIERGELTGTDVRNAIIAEGVGMAVAAVCTAASGGTAVVVCWGLGTGSSLVLSSLASRLE